MLSLAVLYIICCEVAHGWRSLGIFKQPMFLMQFAFCASLFLVAAKYDRQKVNLAAEAFVWANAAIGVTVVIFRFLPSVEAAYLSSPFVTLFNSPAQVAVVHDLLGVNVSDPGKAGGLLYLNGNQCTAYLLCVGALSQMILTGKRAVQFGLAFLAMAICTGSKTPWFALPIVAVLTVTLYYTKRLPAAARTAIICGMVVVAIVADQWLGVSARVAGIDTFQIRMKLWSRAVEHIGEYFIFGAPEGYWDQLWWDYGSLYWVLLPVHNYTLALLMNGGIIALLLVLAQVVLMLHLLTQAAAQGHVKSYWAVAAITYVVLYSQVENFTFFGDSRVCVVLGLTYALAIDSARRRKIGQGRGRPTKQVGAVA